MDPTRTAIVIGSTREGRFGEVIARWVAEEADKREDLDVFTIDLRALHLPAVHEAWPGPAVQELSHLVESADAFVVVTPEYNHGYPAALKYALDSAKREWAAKPVAFVSYGGISGGARAVEQLRPVFSELHAATIRNGLLFPAAWNKFDSEGQPVEPGTGDALEAMLDQLQWWATALKRARQEQPYAA